MLFDFCDCVNVNNEEIDCAKSENKEKERNITM